MNVRPIDTIAGYAVSRSKGAWKPYKYLLHVAAIVQQKIVKGGGRFILVAPPRHGKSEVISRWTPGWFLEHWPEKRVILTSYAAAKTADWGRAILDDRGRSRVRNDASGASQWMTPEGGGVVCAGVDGPIVGRGADLFIIDDPSKNWDEAHSQVKLTSFRNWLSSSAMTRLEPGATVLCATTRWHKADCMAILQEFGDKWEVLSLPAIAEEDDPIGRAVGEALCPERYSIADLEAIKAPSPILFNTIYQGKPSNEMGGVFKREWFGRHTFLPSLVKQWQSWDLTFKESGSSMVAGQVWGLGRDGNRYMLAEYRGQFGFADTLALIRSASRDWPDSSSRVLIEDKANGPAAQSALASDPDITVVMSSPGSESKLYRAIAVQGDVQGGRVSLPEGEPWVEEFIDEVCLFPFCKYSDRVDAMSQSLVDCRESTKQFFIGNL